MKQKLPKAFKRKWVQALRSGEYEQGVGALKSGGKFCCLGVACEIVGAKPGSILGYIMPGQGIKGISKIPELIKGNGELPIKLSGMNDKGKTFKQIATWIDKNL